MTLASTLMLPTQIPWQRLATSEDMMDTRYGDRSFPLKWKSSLSLFFFQPALDKELFGDSLVTYLKVVCSITGYQVDANELGVNLDAGEQWDDRVWHNFNKLIHDYYPCYGALLQVSVFPGPETTETLDYPWIIDFEPKKREMYE